MAEKYTLADLRGMTEDTITPEIAGKVLGCTGFLLGEDVQERAREGAFPVYLHRAQNDHPAGGIHQLGGGTDGERRE